MRKFFRLIWKTLTAPFRLIAWVIKKIIRWFQAVFHAIGNFFTTEPAENALPDVLSNTIEHPAIALEHLNDLRKHLTRAVTFLLIAVLFAFNYAPQIIDWLSAPIGGISKLQAIDVTESISVFMRVSLLSGFSIALPYIAFELLLFAAPGLKRGARVKGLFAIPLLLVFFLGGMAFSYYVMLPTALPFLLNFIGISTIPRPSSYIRFVTGLMFWIGIAFEFPLVIYALAGMGLVRAKTLAEQWRLAVVIIAIIAAAITPTIDPINMLLVMGPMILLYFLSIGLARIAQQPVQNDAE